MSRVFVTGAAGFIGSHLCDRLIADGHEVIGIDNFQAGKRENIAQLLDHPLFILFDDDILHFPYDIFDGPIDFIFHLAASKKNVCLASPRRDLSINAGGTLKLLQWAAQKGAKFIHSSTGSVYGDCWGETIDEQTPLNPCSYYGISKTAGENYVKYFTRQKMTEGIALRYFHIYGPRQDFSQDQGGVISIWCDKALRGKPLILSGDREITRTFTFVGDVVEANIKAMDWPAVTGPVNISSGKVVTLGKAIDLIGKETGKKLKVIEAASLIGDVHDYSVNNLKSLDLGMTYRDFETGLSETVKWHKKRLS